MSVGCLSVLCWMDLNATFYVGRTWPKGGVIKFCKRSGSLSGNKNPEFLEMPPGLVYIL